MNINKIYQNKQIIKEMQEYFSSEAFIQLNHFLDCNLEKIKQEILKQKFIEIYKPLEYKKTQLKIKQITNFETIQFIEFFKSKEFIEYIEEIIEFELRLKSINLNKYSHKDYTILNDLSKNEEYIHIYFDLTQNWKKEFGGTLTYTTKEEEIFYLEPLFNSLTILYNPQGLMNYLKYINNLSKNNSILRIEIKLEIIEEN